MFENFGEYLTAVAEEKEISKDLLLEVVEATLIQALKRKYKDEAEFHIEFDERQNPTMYRKVTVVETVDNPNTQITLEEAKALDDGINPGDDVWLILDEVKEFGRIESNLAKTTFFQKLGELEKNLIYNEFKRRENQLVNGYYQREYKGTIYVNLGKTEGILSRRDQSPREHYNVGDRIRAYIYKVDNSRAGHPSIFLTRTKVDFIKKLFELEIPEIADGIVEIRGAVRQPGIKTKIAVISNKQEVDPVGACVGQKGVRIQAIIKEIEGEKIDIIKWSKDIREFIANAIAPAKASRVVIVDPANYRAIVVVPDDQLSLAIGKGGYNIKMTSDLVGYSIDIKTESDVKADPSVLGEGMSLQQMFVSDEEAQALDAAVSAGEGESNLYSLESLPEATIQKLIESDIDSIEKLYRMSEEEIAGKTGFSLDEVKNIVTVMKESVEVVDDETDADNRNRIAEEVLEEIEMYECPNCGAEISETMTKCPKCGIEITFE